MNPGPGGSLRQKRGGRAIHRIAPAHDARGSSASDADALRSDAVSACMTAGLRQHGRHRARLPVAWVGRYMRDSYKNFCSMRVLLARTHGAPREKTHSAQTLVSIGFIHSHNK